MLFSIITLFPEMFGPVLSLSMLGRAQKRGILKFEFINIRDFGIGVHQVVDGKPYGGGVGMVFRADILAKALVSIKRLTNSKVVLMSASGSQFKQPLAKTLAKLDQLIIVCGHYEGVDQRFIEKYVDQEISIGDFVLTGGEIPAMAVIDSISRLVPEVLTKSEAIEKESFENDLLEHPQYTRPETFEDISVPEVLLSGNHQEVDKWRLAEQIKKTKRVRPDLLKKDQSES